MLSLLVMTLVILNGLLVAGSILYLLILLLAAERAHRANNAVRGLSLSASLPRFLAVIPAHNEELVLAGTLESLRAQDYPKSEYAVLVIADNCTDSTAELARALGVTVWERSNLQQRGKGYALAWAFEKLLAQDNPADAYAIIDADTWVAPDFVGKMAIRLVSQVDDRGYCALQGRYGVLNADEGWRAALMAGAFDLFNHVKPMGRDHFKLSVGLKGNGMVFTRELLRNAPWSGSSVTEDIDYGLDLARHHNTRVAYAPEAVVLAQMPTTAAQAASQRDRWEGGRLALLKDKALPLLREGLQTRSMLLIDPAIDLMIPPLAELAGLLALWTLLVLGGIVLHLLPVPLAWSLAVGLTWFGLLVYVLGGFRVSEASPLAYTALLRAPAYAAWKFALALRRTRRSKAASEEWVRTERAPISGSSAQQEPPTPVATSKRNRPSS